MLRKSDYYLVIFLKCEYFGYNIIKLMFLKGLMLKLAYVSHKSWKTTFFQKYGNHAFSKSSFLIKTLLRKTAFIIYYTIFYLLFRKNPMKKLMQQQQYQTDLKYQTDLNLFLKLWLLFLQMYVCTRFDYIVYSVPFKSMNFSDLLNLTQI